MEPPTATVTPPNKTAELPSTLPNLVVPEKAELGKRLPEASPTRSRGETRRPMKITKLNLTGDNIDAPDEVDEHATNEAPLMEYEISPTHSPSQSPSTKQAQLPKLLRNQPLTILETPANRSIQTPAGSEHRPSAPPYTRDANAAPTPQPLNPTQTALTHADDQPPAQTIQQDDTHRRTETTHPPATQHTRIPNPVTETTPIESTPSPLPSNLPIGLRFKKNIPSQDGQMAQAVNQTQSTQPGEAAPQRDDMAVDNFEQDNDPDSPHPNRNPPTPTNTPGDEDTAPDSVPFAPTPPNGFPHVQLGSDPTFLLAKKTKDACDAKPHPKFWAHLWQSEYDKGTQGKAQLALQRIIYQRTNEKPNSSHQHETKTRKAEAETNSSPPTTSSSAKACNLLLEERAASTPQTQAFFIPFNPSNPTYICTIRGFNFEALDDESSPITGANIDAIVRRVVQNELKEDQTFASLIRTWCMSSASLNTFINAIGTQGHMANLPKPRGSNANAPHPKEQRWN
ncbi:hypothetical protein H0H92_014173 [Tricholoma furcatifolium]|nr:hypothetical protein H0H92_014173 [Tricholoma furcatifolium]